MTRSLPLTLLLCIALAVSIGLVKPVHQLRERTYQETLSSIGDLPAGITQTLALEFKGIAADLLFLKTITFIGYYIGEDKNPSPAEWQTTYQLLERTTDLDPRFWDPYVFGEMMFAWQADMLDEADRLLHKAAKAKSNDYRPFYYLGFNQFYFRKKTKQAAPYLREAARLPGAPSFLKGLASRFSLYGSQTVMGIIFLEDLLEENPDPSTRQYLEKRLAALKSIYSLEQAVLAFKKANNRLPENFEELITERFLEKIPQDPYGGKFVLLKNGRVYTTSDMVPMRTKQPAIPFAPGN